MLAIDQGKLGNMFVKKMSDSSKYLQATKKVDDQGKSTENQRVLFDLSNDVQKVDKTQKATPTQITMKSTPFLEKERVSKPEVC